MSKKRIEKQNQDAKIVCPHCRTTGNVHTIRHSVNRGVSLGKLVAAVFTAGVSLILVGLCHKGTAVALKCSNCGITNVVDAMRFTTY